MRCRVISRAAPDQRYTNAAPLFPSGGVRLGRIGSYVAVTERRPRPRVYLASRPYSALAVGPIWTWNGAWKGLAAQWPSKLPARRRREMEKLPMTAEGYAVLEAELKQCQQV